MPSDPGRVQSIFLAAVEAKTPGSRAAVLDRECAANEELRRRVEALLGAFDDPDGLLDRPIAGLAERIEARLDHDDDRTRVVAAREPKADFTVDQSSAASGTLATGETGAVVLEYLLAEGPGSSIGRYKLLERIGEGGMGAVYMADQEKPIHRRVALKIIKPGMDSAQIIARFEAERQALALMDHPSIARVLDAGTTGGGRPYFVMELVHGVPITEYCDEAQLTLRERLELFIPVCQAIQHAHQKGVIHRDIKPSNVLVTLVDGKPVPKVIDFGVAKAIDQQLTGYTVQTQFGSIIGTLEYMSPEQANLSPLGVDTRSDIYSLGVMLFELLTGNIPLDRARLKKAGYVEILKRIKEDETPKPSTRVGDSGTALPANSARRKTEATKLAALMRGEVDWIVMKALEKDRSRRYETADGFARDIRRYLDGDAVEACPPSTSYRLRKFAGKHRTSLAVASGFVALLVIGSVLSTWQAIRATRAETKARAESAKANRFATESRAVLDFFQKQVLAAARPEGQDGGLGTEVTVRKAVDAAAAKIAAAFSGQPAVEGSVRYVLGATYRRLGEQKQAIPQLERAQQIRSATLGPNHPETLDIQNELALAYWGDGQLGRVIPLIERTLAAQKARLGPDHANTIISQNDLGVAYLEDGQFDRAVPLLEQTLAAEKTTLGPDHIETLNTQNNLGAAYRDAGALDRAIPLLERTIVAEVRSAQIGPGHPNTLSAQNNLALCYQADGQLGRAIALLEQTLAARRARLGLDHPATLISQNTLALAYDQAREDARAEPLFREVLVLRKKKRGPNHPHVAVTLVDLGRYLIRKKRYAEAEPLAREGLAIWKVNRPDGWQRFDAESLYGASLLGQGKYAEAEPLILSGFEGLRVREAKMPAPSKHRLTEAGESIVQLYNAWGKPERATEWGAKLATQGEKALPAR